MNSKLVLVVRILLALILIVFGLNKFIGFMGDPGFTGDAGAYMGALTSVNMFVILGVLEVLCGLAFLTGKYNGLAIIITAAIAFNALIFHVFLAMDGIAPAAALTVLVIIMYVANKDKFAEVFKA